MAFMFLCIQDMFVCLHPCECTCLSLLRCVFFSILTCESVMCVRVCVLINIAVIISTAIQRVCINLSCHGGHRGDSVRHLLLASWVSVDCTSAEHEDIKLINCAFYVCGMMIKYDARMWVQMIEWVQRMKNFSASPHPSLICCYWIRMIFQPQARTVGQSDNTPTVAPSFLLQCLCLLLSLSLSVFGRLSFFFSFHVTKYQDETVCEQSIIISWN